MSPDLQHAIAAVYIPRIYICIMYKPIRRYPLLFLEQEESHDLNGHDLRLI